MTGAVLEEALAILRKSRVVGGLPPGELHRLVRYMERVEVPAHHVIIREGDRTRDLYLVIEGTAQAERGRVHMAPLGPGSEFGSLGLLTDHPRAATVKALTNVALARLSLVAWQELSRDEPAIALKVAQALFNQVRADLTHLTDSLSALMQGRTLPRAETVELRWGTRVQLVPTGTPLRELLPREHEGHLVVGALLGQKPVSLSTPVVSSTTVEPLTVEHWEGWQIYARSVQLLLLEAAYQLDPKLDVRVGPSLGTSQLIEVHHGGQHDRERLARRLQEEMERLAATEATFRREHWTVDEASELFRERGWGDAAQLLLSSRSATVPMISVGQVYALSLGAMMPDTRELSGFSVTPHEQGLVLGLGGKDPRQGALLAAPRHRDGAMEQSHRDWLAALGVTSVGAFNQLCVSGEVVKLLRVSEGFHEKQISRIADSIAAARDRLRIICIAGPSSSGKTTFIKRLTVQLQINGLNPMGVSLDDYYVDREKNVKDARGEYDFEALEALDLELLQDHVKRLLAGETVKMARYDFKTGRSDPHGGHARALGAGDLLMMEGIHGLNPRLLGSIPRPEQLFRVFVHPATALPFDRASRVSPTDLRLLRRIVRDRHGRGSGAAENIARWPSVLAGEREHIFPFQGEADVVFDSALIYEPSVLKVYAERYLLEVPAEHPSFATAFRLRHLVDRFVAIDPEHVPPTSLIREFIGGSGFEY